MLWEGGADFETPPPLFTKEGMFKPFPPTGARTLDSRTAFYYGYTLDSPGMIMRIPNVGSQYLMGFLDADKKPLDGGKTYKVTLPKNIPARAFWSLTVYDNQTRSMLDTPQRYPRAGSQRYPSPAADANADGSTTIYFGPKQPDWRRAPTPPRQPAGGVRDSAEGDRRAVRLALRHRERRLADARRSGRELPANEPNSDTGPLPRRTRPRCAD
jgi:hypothetical protein